MKTIECNQPINLKVVKFELDFVTPRLETPNVRKNKKIDIPTINYRRKQSIVPAAPPCIDVPKTPNVQELVDNLLEQLYSENRNWSTASERYYGHGSVSAVSLVSSQSTCGEETDTIERSYLEALDTTELIVQLHELRSKLRITGEKLARYLRIRDRYNRQQKRLCSAFTVMLRQISGESGPRFTITPGAAGEGGYGEWLEAMRLVARLPAGVPQHFRKKLWLTLSERYLTSRGVDWSLAERACFRGTAQPDDTELGAQILKDLHRTGCSLFCGTEGRENQAMLRRVLLAYARWNKEVGYCQGFNMLAAIILEVMEKSEPDSLKVMIYLVEAVLPEGYFADDLRGLSADMAAFRDLLRLRLPKLANHMDYLQRISDGGGVEPPLPDVFTMQWFLTLYATWLPRESLLRIWDLILLDGNEVLLLTALAIWDMLQDRILSTRTADEYYSCMGGGAGAVWAASESLVARVVALGSAPELPRLRNVHRYRVTPPAAPPLHSAMQTMTKKGLRLFYSEDEGDSSDDGNKMALATVVPRRDETIRAGDRLSLDIGALKRQYARLRERQRQAHVILAAACARHAAVGVPTSPTSLTVNNLLLGKSAIVSSRGRRLGPPPGAVPPSRHSSAGHSKSEPRKQGCSDETISWEEEKNKKTLSRRNSLKWKDVKKEGRPVCRKASIDFDETGDGVIVSENEANEMIASLRSRSSSESSSYSSRSKSSTDTSLCDDKVSDTETDLPLEEDKQHKHSKAIKQKTSKSNSEVVLPKSPPNVSKISNMSASASAANISDYIESVAGQSLRTYIDEFQNSKASSYSPVNETYELAIPAISKESKKSLSDIQKSVLDIDNYSKCSSPKYGNSENFKIKPQPRSSPNFTELSPIELSPCKFDYDMYGSYGCDPNFTSSSPHVSRPPDIIDSLTKYPNFIPDIDLSDKISDIDSPVRSPGAESIVVSEDEPPIPLKIDKYFEHSPEFFGARITITDPSNANIPNRRAPKRLLRHPKKPDSLNLQSNNSKLLEIDDSERASSLPQHHKYVKKIETPKTQNKTRSPIFVSSDDMEIKDAFTNTVSLKNQLSVDESSVNKITDYFSKTNLIETTNEDKCSKYSEIHKTPDSVSVEPNKNVQASKQTSPNEIFMTFGRKNSERALQIIQENSKILSRILTKQSISKATKLSDVPDRYIETATFQRLKKESKEYSNLISETRFERYLPESPLLKESTSDSLIGYSQNKKFEEFTGDKNEFLRNRPISLDEPLSFELEKLHSKMKDSMEKAIKSPSAECLGNKTDCYGWENKGFSVKSDYQSPVSKIEDKHTLTYGMKPDLPGNEIVPSNTEWSKSHESFSLDSKTSVTLPSSEHKDNATYDRRYTSDDYNYSFSSKYNDFVLSRASDICSKTADLGPKICENLSKTDNSEFANVVTSSISFTFEQSVDDDSPTGIKSNSSDTLCQITSLDQVSTPISPKVFPNRETPTLPRESIEKSDRVKLESDDTCSAITSLIETDTMSSLSFPRSPSTGSYHPFPTRPPIRMPKEIGVRLGMYPKDSVNSPSK